MKEIFTQIRDCCPVCKTTFGLFFLPYSNEDREKTKEFKPFQIVRSQVYGIKKPRSLEQLKLYWAACNFLANNTDYKDWNLKEKVDFHCRVAAHFVDPDLIVVKKDRSVVYSYRSIAFKNLGHMDACSFFSQAFGTMTDFWNATHKKQITVDEFLEMVIQSMKSYEA